METYTTDQERVEVIKKWWRENGNAMMGGALLGLAVVFGYRWWDERGQNYRAQASQQYEALQNTLRAGKLADAEAQINALRTQYQDTPYAALATLIEARIKAERNDLPGARTALTWTVEHAALPELKAVAQLRLARTMLAEGKPDDAQKALPDAVIKAHAVARAELLGDIHAAKGEGEQARAAYAEALAALTPEQSALKAHIEMKRDALGITGGATP